MEDPRIAQGEAESEDAVQAGQELEALEAAQRKALGRARDLLESENALGLSLGCALAGAIASHKGIDLTDTSTWPQVLVTPTDQRTARAFMELRTQRMAADRELVDIREQITAFYRRENR